MYLGYLADLIIPTIRNPNAVNSGCNRCQKGIGGRTSSFHLAWASCSRINILTAASFLIVHWTAQSWAMPTHFPKGTGQNQSNYFSATLWTGFMPVLQNQVNPSMGNHRSISSSIGSINALFHQSQLQFDGHFQVLLISQATLSRLIYPGYPRLSWKFAIILATMRTKPRRSGSVHVSTLMRKMGVEALYRKPGTTLRHPAHRIYPCLLRAGFWSLVENSWWR